MEYRYISRGNDIEGEYVVQIADKSLSNHITGRYAAINPKVSSSRFERDAMQNNQKTTYTLVV